jgi:DNA (cytosine-5)-methyltransferase 1
MEKLKSFFTKCLELKDTSINDASSASKSGGGARVHEELVRRRLLESGFQPFGKKPNKRGRGEHHIRVVYHKSFWEDHPDTVKTLGFWEKDMVEDQLYFLHQPFGSQGKPDYLLFVFSDGELHSLSLECKSSQQHCAMWNDSFPSRDMVFLFTKYSKGKNKCLDTTFFLGSEIVSEDLEKRLETIRRLSKVRQIQDNSTLEGSCVSVYHRTQFNCSEKHLLVSNREEREKRTLEYMMNKLNLNEDYSESESESESSSGSESESDEEESYSEEWTAISLFAGAGGDTLGMKQAGVNVIAFSENNAAAVETHKKNFPDCKWLGADVKGNICKTPDSEFLPYKNKVDILFAGFPCQGFSHAGKKDPNDPRNQLFKEFVRVARLIRPKWIIGENVKGLLKRTTKTKEKAIDIIFKAFEEIGYTMSGPKVLKATHFGVPQKRERMIFVGSLEGESIEIPEGTKQQPKLSFLKYTLDGCLEIDPEMVECKDEKDVLKWVLEPENYQPPEDPVKPHTNLLKCVKANQISYERRASPTHGEMVNPDKPSKTIISHYSAMPRLFVGQKSRSGKHYLRKFSVKELQQIQGFPESFQMCGNIAQQIAQIGNAVPPALIKAVVDVIE